MIHVLQLNDALPTFFHLKIMPLRSSCADSILLLALLFVYKLFEKFLMHNKINLRVIKMFHFSTNKQMIFGVCIRTYLGICIHTYLGVCIRTYLGVFIHTYFGVCIRIYLKFLTILCHCQFLIMFVISDVF